MPRCGSCTAVTDRCKSQKNYPLRSSVSLPVYLLHVSGRGLGRNDGRGTVARRRIGTAFVVMSQTVTLGFVIPAVLGNNWLCRMGRHSLTPPATLGRLEDTPYFLTWTGGMSLSLWCGGTLSCDKSFSSDMENLIGLLLTV